MSVLKRVLFASGSVMRVLLGAGAIALLVVGLKKNAVRNQDKGRVLDRDSSGPPGKP